MFRYPRALVALALVAACGGSGGTAGGGPSTTPPAWAGSTTTVTTAPTTTTDPGLGTQTLELRIEPDHLDKYDMAVAVEMVITGDDVDRTTTSMSWSGKFWLMTLPGPAADTIDVVGDFRVDAGELEMRQGTTEFSQELDEEMITEISGIVGGFVVDAVGAPVDLRDGTPNSYVGYAFTVGRITEVPLPETAVGVGDTWTAEREVPVLGTAEFAAEAVAEEELDGVLGFRIDYTGEFAGLPLELDLDDITAMLATDPDTAATLEAFALEGYAIGIRAVGGEITGSYLFDPVAGDLLESAETVALRLELSIATPEGEFAFELDENMTTEMTLAHSEAVTIAEKSGLFARMEADPDLLADAGIILPAGYEMSPAADLDSNIDVHRILEDAAPGWFAGYSLRWLLAPDGETELMVIAATPMGSAQGDPSFGAYLARFWGGGDEPDEVAVGEYTAWGFEGEDDEWLVAQNEELLFIIAGPRTTAVEVMRRFLDRSPYRWEVGDCLDLADWSSPEPPAAPFGEVALRHCASSHTHEVIFADPLTDLADAEYPGFELEDRAIDTCYSEFAAYTGSDRPVDTALGVMTFYPTEFQWELGQRFIACTVYQAGPDAFVPVTGWFAGLGPDLEVTLEEGTCLSYYDLPVPCSDPHATQVFYVGAHPDTPDDLYPGSEDRFGQANSECLKYLTPFGLPTYGHGDVGLRTDGPAEVEVWWIDDFFVTWDEGDRDLYCIVYALDEEGYLVDVIGSFDGEWQLAVTGRSS